MIRRSVWKQAACALVLCAMALLTLPLGAQEDQAVSEKDETYEGTFFAGFACLGEPVVYSTTLHLVYKPYPYIIHGNQINAEAYGLFTGNRFVFGGSPANLVPAADGTFLYHLTFIGPGKNAPKYSITAIGGIGVPALEVIQEQCVNPVYPD